MTLAKGGSELKYAYDPSDGAPFYHIYANHLMTSGLPIRGRDGIPVYGWWVCYYLRGSLFVSFRDACAAAKERYL